MIEDKFGAELLGLQLPVSSLGRLLPSRLQEHLSAFILFCSSSQLFSVLLLQGRKLWGWEAWAAPGLPHTLCPAVLSLPTPLHLSPHQPVAQLRFSVPAPSWSLPHLPTPTGRSTAGKRAPGPPDQTAPAVLLKVRGTQRWAWGLGVVP